MCNEENEFLFLPFDNRPKYSLCTAAFAAASLCAHSSLRTSTGCLDALRKREVIGKG